MKLKNIIFLVVIILVLTPACYVQALPSFPYILPNLPMELNGRTYNHYVLESSPYSGYYYVTLYDNVDRLYADAKYIGDEFKHFDIRNNGQVYAEVFTQREDDFTLVFDETRNIVALNQIVFRTMDYDQLSKQFIMCNFDLKDKDGNLLRPKDEQPPYHDYYINDEGRFLTSSDIDILHKICLKFERNRQIQLFVDTYDEDIDNINDFTISLAQDKLMGVNSAGIIQVVLTPTQRSVIFSNHTLSTYATTNYYDVAEKFLYSELGLLQAINELYNETMKHTVYTLAELGRGPFTFKRVNFNYDYALSTEKSGPRLVPRQVDQTINQTLNYGPLDDYTFYDVLVNGTAYEDWGLTQSDAVLTTTSSGNDYYSNVYNMYARVYSNDKPISTPNSSPAIYTPLPSPTGTSGYSYNTPIPQIPNISPDDFNLYENIFDDTINTILSIEDIDNVPSLKFSLRQLVVPISISDSMKFSDEEVEYVDFNIFETVQYNGVKLIDFFRGLIGASFIVATIFRIKSMIFKPTH